MLSVPQVTVWQGPVGQLDAYVAIFAFTVALFASVTAEIVPRNVLRVGEGAKPTPPVVPSSWKAVPMVVEVTPACVVCRELTEYSVPDTWAGHPAVA